MRSRIHSINPLHLVLLSQKLNLSSYIVDPGILPAEAVAGDDCVNMTMNAVAARLL